MDEWIVAVAETGSLVSACDRVGITLIAFREARRHDSAFEKACRVHDEIVALRISDAVRSLAAEGDLRSQSLYYKHKRVREPAPGSGCIPGDSSPFSPAEAEAIIHASLEALESRLAPTPTPPSATRS